MTALLLPAARASLRTVPSFSPQPSRTQTRMSLPSEGGAAAPKWTASLRGSFYVRDVGLHRLRASHQPALQGQPAWLADPRCYRFCIAGGASCS